MKRMHYLKKGLNVSLLIVFTGIYKRAKLQTVMFWQHRFTRLQFWATDFSTVCIYFKRYLWKRPPSLVFILILNSPSDMGISNPNPNPNQNR